MTRSGVGRLRLQVPVHLVVQRVLVVGKIEAREQRILVEQEIRDRGLAEQIELRQPAQLVDPLEQERELRGQREARHVVVESRQEWIVLRLLEQHLRVEMLGQLPREARLACADGTLDDDVVAALEVHRRLVKKMRTGARDPLAAHRAPVPARKSAARNCDRRRDVEQRTQDERAFVHARMRYDEVREADPAAPYSSKSRSSVRGALRA